MSKLTKLEWIILDMLSEFPANVALTLSLIKDDFPDISQKEVAEVVFKLYKLGLVFEDKNLTVDLQALSDEPEDYIDNKHWFGLTEAGCKLWEKDIPTYSGEAIDWSKRTSGSYSFDKKEGFIEGVSKKSCLAALESWMQHEKDWELDRDTIVFTKINGFKAKYYKYIPGGYRLTFKLKKSQNNIAL